MMMVSSANGRPPELPPQAQTAFAQPDAESRDWALDQSMSACCEEREYKNKLIPREVEILRLLVEGQTSWDISKIFQISPEWVNAHISNITNKMGVGNSEAAADRARRDQLFQQKIFQ